MTFHLVGHFRALADHRVRYLIVGGVGGRLQGVPTTTGDLDIVPDPDLDNLQRLAVALSGPNTWKKPVDSVEFVQHPVVEPSEFWSERMTQYRTVNGGIDVLIELPGVGPFDALIRASRRYELAGYDLTIHVANLDDIIRSKEYADRAKDWRALDSYYEARAAQPCASFDLVGKRSSVDTRQRPPAEPSKSVDNPHRHSTSTNIVATCHHRVAGPRRTAHGPSGADRPASAPSLLVGRSGQEVGPSVRNACGVPVPCQNSISGC